MSMLHFPRKLRLETVVWVCIAAVGLLLFYELFFSPDFAAHWRLIQRLP